MGTMESHSSTGCYFEGSLSHSRAYILNNAEFAHLVRRCHSLREKTQTNALLHKEVTGRTLKASNACERNVA